MAKSFLDSYYSFHFKNIHKDKNLRSLFEGYAGWYSAILPKDKNRPILDLGCGTGEFLSWLRSLGYVDVEGAEMSSELRNEAIKRYGFTVHLVENPVEFLCEVSGKYHCITMLDFLEHLQEETIFSILNKTYEILPDQGKIIVSVPQAAGITSLFLRYADFTHKTLFTETSLCSVLQAAGFQNIDLALPVEKIRWSLKSISYRMLRMCWHNILRLIYILERPGEVAPKHFWDRIVVSAVK